MRLTEIKNKVVILRVDFNVPIQYGKISDHTRISSALPTIELLIKNNCKIVLISHLGRPKSSQDQHLSLKKILPDIKSILKKNIEFSELDDAYDKLKNLKYSEILLLENIRFYPEEEENDINFAKKLASLGEIYVNDAFSVSHREHASIVGIPQYISGCNGISFNNEVENLSKISGKNSVAIIGGSKISTKLPLIESLLKKIDKIIVVGALVNTIIKNQGYNIGKSLFEDINVNLDIERVFIPFDFITSTSLDNKNFNIVDVSAIPKEEIILDIGPGSILKIKKILQQAETILWNGPLGAFEHNPFHLGTKEIAKFISSLTKAKGITSILGGGDTISVINDLEEKNFSYISTAGGAFLQFLEKNTLIGKL
jgi:phosphoglycerate kinase